MIATACLYRSAVLTARSAAVLGRADDEAEFVGLAERTRAAFREHYVKADGTDPERLPDRVRHGDRVRPAGSPRPRCWPAGDSPALVAEGGYRIATGFAGTPYVTEALSRTGHVEEAYRLLLQTENPSWLYPVTMGATTIWERWDSMLPDGTINPGEMTSFNHYALGAVADWLHRTVAGLAPAEPGYRRVRVAPRPGGGITWAKATLTTAHGEIRRRLAAQRGRPRPRDLPARRGDRRGRRPRRRAGRPSTPVITDSASRTPPTASMITTAVT